MTCFAFVWVQDTTASYAFVVYKHAIAVIVMVPSSAHL